MPVSSLQQALPCTYDGCLAVSCGGEPTVHSLAKEDGMGVLVSTRHVLAIRLFFWLAGVSYLWTSTYDTHVERRRWLWLTKDIQARNLQSAVPLLIQS